MSKTTLKDYYLSLGIDEKVYDFCSDIEAGLEDRFKDIDNIAEHNQPYQPRKQKKIQTPIVQKNLANTSTEALVLLQGFC